MFNSKKIKVLEEDNDRKVKQISELNNKLIDKDREIHKLKVMLNEITAYKDKIPEDCTPGSYCKSCEFAKKYYYSNGWTIKEYYVCAKSESCSKFVQKEGDR
jgi:hypothetical protein